MITNLIRTALAPSIEMILNVERIRLIDIINEMENAVDEVKSIRARDIADNISTYDIAQDISLDSYDIGRNIEIDASDIEVDTRDLAERIAAEIGGNIDIDISQLASELGSHISIDASDIEVNTSDLVDRICEQIGCNITVDEQNIEIDYSALGHIVGNLDIDTSDIEIDYSSLAYEIAREVDMDEVNARINNVHTNLQTVERKMDLILKHLGITPDNA
jgi:hypothetical protein